MFPQSLLPSLEQRFPFADVSSDAKYLSALL